MPQFMKSKAISILEGGIESYILALYGLSIPTVRHSKQLETKYAPIIGLLGTAVELVIKACLVQGEGIQAMYENGDVEAGFYKQERRSLRSSRMAYRKIIRRLIIFGKIKMQMKNKKLQFFRISTNFQCCQC